ncbi:MAG TPA: hypothetical protein H9837_10025 [Candidatus Brachybacterium merdigallinarum]|nr:hypothetical protein [Candidatus Brachybacterium merdigallinarum]
MTSPHTRALPPLRDLPPPPVLEPEDTSLIPPAEIIIDSRRALTRRLLQLSWVPALYLIGLWYVLLGAFLLGASPAFWFLGLIATLEDPTYLRYTLLSLGFDQDLTWIAVLLLPTLATLVSLALLPVATMAVGGMQPRTHLSEQGFQKQFATRITAVLLAPPLLVIALLPIAVGLGAPLPWNSIGAGPLSALCLAALAVMAAWAGIRAWVSAPRVLGVTPHGDLLRTSLLERDRDQRKAAAAQVLAQDRRHLPPNLGTPQNSGALTVRGALTGLGLILRAGLTWVLPAAAGTGVILFPIADFVLVINGMLQYDLQDVPTGLSLAFALLGLPIAALVVLAVAVTPALAVLSARGLRGQVRDQRTYPEWAHRARVNPWEARVVTVTGLLTGAAVAAGAIGFGILLGVVGGGTGLAWTIVTLLVLLVAPLAGAGASAAMRQGLRGVLYGPAGRFMRRESPYALVAPDIGTRADRAKDPVVRAEIRRRLNAQAGDHSLEIFDLDAAGERLWVDDSQPGATDTAVRAADLASGTLPDFGGEGSAFTGGGRPAGTLADHSEDPHHVPDSDTGLREG